MGAGDYEAGDGPAGLDPLLAADDIEPTKRTAYLDLESRLFPLDASGQVVQMHPVDQAVAIALGIPLFGATSAPNTGLDIVRLRRTRKAAMQVAVLDEVSRALQSLIASGDIVFFGAPLMPDAKGRPFFYVDYKNLRLPSNELGPPRTSVRA